MLEEIFKKRRFEMAAELHKEEVKFFKKNRYRSNIIRLCEKYKGIDEKDNFNIVVFKIYLAVGKLKETADLVNKLGYRIKTSTKKGERKYQANEIREILFSDVDVDPLLKDLVRKIFKENKKKVRWKW